MDAAFWNNLLSGAIGAVIGALASVVALLITNRYTRIEGRRALDQQEMFFKAQQESQQEQFDRQLLSDKDLARQGREAEAVAALLSYLQDDFVSDPLDGGHPSRITALCTLLFVNASPELAGAWLDRMRGNSGGALHRHPLAAAIAARTGALRLAEHLPSTAIHVQGDYEYGTALQLLTEDSEQRLIGSVNGICAEMLLWSSLPEAKRATMFDFMIEEARHVATETLSYANLLLGGTGDHCVIDDLVDEPELTEMINLAEELGTPMDDDISNMANDWFSDDIDTTTLPRAPKAYREVRLVPITEELSGVEYFGPAFLDGDQWVEEILDVTHTTKLRNSLSPSQEELAEMARQTEDFGFRPPRQRRNDE